MSANGGSSQNTYIVSGNAPDLSSHVSTSSDLGLDVAPVSWMESRDHNWGLLMAAVRHRVQIEERRRGICMVLGASIRSSIQRRKISESSSMGSDPNVPHGRSDGFDACNTCIVLIQPTVAWFQTRERRLFGRIHLGTLIRREILYGVFQVWSGAYDINASQTTRDD